ncbi:MAG: GDP-mannose 4,6-dehydratase [Candidatus Helarchaeota archaeon]
MSTFKCLVTGGAGFIGSHVVDAFLADGHDVIIIDDLSEGNMINIEHIADKVELEIGTVKDAAFIEELVEDVDVICHLAANASVSKSVHNPKLDFESNVIGTFNLLKAIMNTDVKKFIYASSAAVYGEPEKVPIKETDPLKPVSPYGASKVSGEHYVSVFNSTYGVKSVSLRIFNSIGERQPRYVIYDLLKKLMKNLCEYGETKELEVLGTGENIRDFIYVGDVARTFLECAKKSIVDGNIYNVGTGVGHSISSLAEEILKALNFTETTKIRYTGSSWQGDVSKLIADISKLQNDLNFEFTPFPEALQHEIDWFNKNIRDLTAF